MKVSSTVLFLVQKSLLITEILNMYLVPIETYKNYPKCSTFSL